MDKKFKLSATVLALLIFTLMLFYQNCAQQSGDLGSGPVTPPDNNNNNGTNPYKVSCAPRSINSNKFDVKLENVGFNAVVTVDVNNSGVTASIPQGPNTVPSDPNVCPGGNSSAVGCPAPSAAYKELYGPWVWAGCPCLRASTHNFNFSVPINGYISGFTQNEGYDLSGYVNQITSLEFYVKENVPNSIYISTGRNPTGNHASCILN